MAEEPALTTIKLSPTFNVTPQENAEPVQIWRFWRHVLRRRSQRGRFTLERMARLYDRWLIPPRLVHPYPSVRFDAIHPRQEPLA
jgi:hypothetical protein